MRRREYYWTLFHSTENNQIESLRTDQVEAVFAAIPASMRSEWFIWRDGFDGWKPFTDFPQLLVSLRRVDARQVETPPPPPPAQTNTFAHTNPLLAPDDKVPAPAPISDFRLGGEEVTNTGHIFENKEDSVAGNAKVAKPIVTKPADGTVVQPISGGVPKPNFTKKSDQNIPDADGDFNMSEGSADLTFMADALPEDRSNFRFDKNFQVRIEVGDGFHNNETVNISLKGMQLKTPLPSKLPRYFNVEIINGKRVIPVVCSEVRNPDGSGSTRVKIEVNDYTPGLLAMLLSA